MMQAGRELDALVAEKVFGWKRAVVESHGAVNNLWVDADGKPARNGYYGASCVSDEYNAFSTRIEAAWTVVEKLRADKETDFDLYAPAWAGTANMMGGNWKAMIDGYAGVSATAPLAICLAALAAVGYKEPA